MHEVGKEVSPNEEQHGIECQGTSFTKVNSRYLLNIREACRVMVQAWPYEIQSLVQETKTNRSNQLKGCYSQQWWDQRVPDRRWIQVLPLLRGQRSR